jgi:hypothetical protein
MTNRCWRCAIEDRFSTAEPRSDLGVDFIVAQQVQMARFMEDPAMVRLDGQMFSRVSVRAYGTT